MTTARSSSNRFRHWPARGLVCLGAILLAAATCLSLLVFQVTAPEVYAPPPREILNSSDSPEERERNFPARLSSELWLGMSRAEVETTAHRHGWGFQPATDATEFVARRDDFPSLPEAMTWFAIRREGAGGGVDLGFANDVLIYKSTRGSLRGMHTTLPEAAPEYRRPQK